MATNLKSWLNAGTALPAAIEAKFSKLPKLTTALNKITTMVPAGPAIYPNPPASGLPILGVDKIPTPPKLFGSPMGLPLKLKIIPSQTVITTPGGSKINLLQVNGEPSFTFK